MASAQRPLVNIPDEQGVHTKSAGVKGEKYVYKYVKYYRNADGNPRNKAKSIGKYDPATGKMIPNSNYFELFHLDPTLHEVTVWDYGYSYLVVKACSDTGLLGCLAQAFGERAMEIVVTAAFIIREGNAMDGIDDWLQRNYFPGFDRMLTSQTTSKLFGALTPEQMSGFFLQWVKVSLSNGSVCYDVTSISSYAREMPSVERGYNRDGDDLAQYNLGMFCDEVSKTPLYYNRYNGSLTDKTNLSYVLANAKAVGIERVKMVLDGGFWSEECMESLHSLCDAFTVGMPAYLKDSEEILAAHGDGIEKYANELVGRQVYCVPVETEIYGVPGRVMLYYDPWNHLNLCNELSDKINRLSAELDALKRYPKSKLSRYTPYFVITKHESDNGFDYMVDTDKVEQIRKNKGFFLIFSSDIDATPTDILDNYRAKDADEKIFDQIKIDMGGSRIRTHNEQTTDGKTFVTFIACVIRSYMLRKLENYLIANSASLKKALSQLSNIIIISGQEGYRFTKALSKKQKQILAAFDATDDIVSSLT
jgi:transposase